MNDAEGDCDGNEPQNLFIPKDLAMGKHLKPRLRLAVYTGKIAAVGNGHPQIIDATVERIVKGHRKTLPQASVDFKVKL